MKKILSYGGLDKNTKNNDKEIVRVMARFFNWSVGPGPRCNMLVNSDWSIAAQ